MNKTKYNLIITSSGFNDINNYVSDEMVSLFNSLAFKKRVMILANAAPEGTGNFIARENVKENFEKAKASRVDIVDLNSENIEVIFNYDLIYGLGGDLTYLIKLNKDLKFKEKLIQFLQKGGIYVGESAGSMILSCDLKWAYEVKKGTKPKYDVKLDSYLGWSLIKFDIFPHWNKTSEAVKSKVLEYEKEHNIKIVKLNDGEFLKVDYKK